MSSSRRNRKKQTGALRPSKRKEVKKSPSRIRCFEDLEQRNLLAANWVTEGSDPFTINNNDIKTSVGIIGTPAQPSATFTGGLQSSPSAFVPANNVDTDAIPFTLAATGNANSKIRVQFTPSNAVGDLLVSTVVSGGNNVSTFNLSNIFSVGNGLAKSGLRNASGGIVSAAVSYPDNKTIEWSLNGLAAGDYMLSLQMNEAVRTTRAIAFTYEAVFESFPSPPGTPDSVKEAAPGLGEVTLPFPEVGQTYYGAGYLEGSPAPGTFMNDPQDTASYLVRDGYTITTLVTDAGAGTITTPTVTFIDSYNYIQIANPTTTSGNRFTWINSNDANTGYHYLQFGSPSDQGGTGYQVFVESYGQVPTADVTESSLSETGDSTVTVSSPIGVGKTTTTVSGILRSYNEPGTALGVSTDQDNVAFVLPSRGTAGSQLVVSLPFAGTPINSLIKSTLTGPNGSVFNGTYDVATNTLRFNLDGADGGSYKLALQSVSPNRGTTYLVSISHSLPTVSFGPINYTNISEGFGFGSTIAGLGGALDTTASNAGDGSWLNGIPLKETNKFTIEGWYYPKAGLPDGVIWSLGTAYQLIRVNDNGLRLRVFRDGASVDGTHFDITVNGALNKDAWNHLAVTFDGENLRLFVNGVVLADVPDTVPDYQSVSLNDPQGLSFNQAAGAQVPSIGTGAVDEIRVWNIARTQEELQENSLTPLTGNEAGLVAYWDFDNPSGELELDSSTSGYTINIRPKSRIENPAPQIGYVDVILDRPVTDPVGLWVTYNITGGTAIRDTDFVSSSFRKVAGQPTTEKFGIIIPYGESKGRIYFYAKPDAIVEPTETVNIALTTNSLLNIAGGRDYNLGATTTATVNIADNGAYTQGIQVTDAAGRPINAANPLYISVTTGQADIYVKLTSQPDYPSFNPQQVSLTFGNYPSVAISYNGAVYSTRTLVFTPDNWDVPQKLTLVQPIVSTGVLKVVGAGSLGTSYIGAAGLTIPFTQVAPNRADVTEGNPTDVSPVTPTVSIVTIRNVKENDDQPALLQVNLDTPAPTGGLDVLYSIANPTSGIAATPGTDYVLPTGVVHVEEGETQAVIPISMIDDNVAEGTESFIIQLAASSRYNLSSNSKTAVEIVDDDQARIVVSNPTVVDVTNTKSLLRPGLNTQESGSIYAYGDSPKQSLGTFGTFDAPGFTFTGGISSNFDGRYDRDTIEFTLATTGDANTKLSLQLTPSTANGEAAIPTRATGADYVNSTALLSVLDATGANGTRLIGGTLTSARRGAVVSNDRLEWSLAGLAAGTYQLVISGSPYLSQIIGQADGATGASYDYVATLTSGASAPYTLQTTSTVTNYSPTYAPLVTNETIPAATLALEPNNSIATAYNLGTVIDGISIPNQMIDSATDVDYYKFTLDSTVGRPDTIALLFDQADNDSKNDLQMWFYNSSGSYFTLADRSTANEFFNLASLADGTYYVAVRGVSAALVSTNYTLKFRTLTNPAEPSIGQTVYLGVAANGDRYNDFAITSSKPTDSFRFTLDTASGRPTSLSLITVPTDGNLSVSLYNWKTGSLISSNSTVDAVKTLSLSSLADGDYEVRIAGVTSGTLNKYDVAFGNVVARATQVDPNQIALRLDSKPLADVTMTLSNSAPGEGRLSKSTLIFTPNNWNQYQLVQVTPIDDGVADGDKTYTITALTSSADVKYHNKTLSFNITNVDRGTFVQPPVQNTNDEPNAPEVAITAIPTVPRSEGTVIDGFLITLSKPATQDLTLKLDYQRGTAILGQNFTVDTGTGNPNEVFIPKGTTSKVLKVTLINDGVDNSATNTNLVVRATVIDMPGYRPATTVDPGYTADFEILDANVAGIIVNGPNGSPQTSTITTYEDQSVAAVSHSVRLATKPTSNVTVYVASSDKDAGVVTTAPSVAGQAVISLLFTPTNWNIAQSFYVKGVDNKIDEGNSVPYKVVVSAQSEDDAYRTLAKQSFNANTIDNDTLGISTTSPQNTINGRTNVFSVVLNTQPLGEVRVTMTPQNDQISINGSHAGDPATLTFNATNWNLPQLVQVVALDDRVVEYIHESQITFSVESGRRYDSNSSADIGVSSQALDLGDISGGIRWNNLSLPPVGDLDPVTTGDQWYRITLSKIGTSLNAIRLLTRGDNLTDIPTLGLYSANGATLIKSGIYTPAQFPAQLTDKAIPATTTLSLDQLAAGTYLIRLSDNGRTSTLTKFDLLIDDATRGFEKYPIAPVTVSITDNDIPIAEVVAGGTASEVFSQPSYFAVRLSAPASTEGSESGVKVNFKISGRATYGTTSSTNHDYTVLADYFDPSTGLGWVRVAPGDVQANIGIVPVDDKLVEDLPVTISNFGSDAVLGWKFKISAKASLADNDGTLDPSYMIAAGTIIKFQLSSTREVEFKIKKDTPLNLVGTDYSADVSVDISQADADLFLANPGTFKGRIESEDVQVTLLGGVGYSLPLAPDKQGASPAIAANLDPDRVVARMNIYDDDVPGVQIIETGDHTTVAEGDATTFKVALTAEPKKTVAVTLTPAGDIEFVNPSVTSNQTIDVVNYTYDDSQVPINLDLNFVSLNETDQGYTAVFDTRLASVSQVKNAFVSTLTVTGANGGGSTTASFEVPGSDDIDFAGQSVEGTWNTFQRLIVTNLKPSVTGVFSFTINLDGVQKTVSLTPAKSTLSRNAVVLTFTPDNWFTPQTVTVSALENSIAEPGEYHKSFVRYSTKSDDDIWNDLTLPNQEVRILDTKLDVGDTINGLEEGLDLLEDSLLGLKLPLIGTIGDLPGIGISASSASSASLVDAQALRAATTDMVATASATTGGLGFFEDFRGPLKKALSTQRDMTVTKFKSIAESALSPLVASGVFDRVIVTPTANESDVEVVFNLDKVIHIASLDLSSDLGLDALGLQFKTTGKARLDIAFSLDVAFGWNKQFGFYLDTAQTGIQAGARLYLTGNGATADNPSNLFTGQGSIGALQLDFSDDPLNRTELSLTFQISLNDLDNINTVKFFDVNGDGILADKPYSFNVGVDANKDGRIDKDSSGNPVTQLRTIEEAWTNITADSTSDPFPTIPSIKNDPNIGDAVKANWNTVGSKTNTFDEASTIKKEGIYRLKTQGNKTIVYLDLDRDGQLDVGRKGLDPFNSPWISMNDANRMASDIWFTPADPKNFKELKIITKGTGADTKYYLDINQDNIGGPFELITKQLADKIDKDGSKTLEGDIISDGEGRYVQGTSIDFYDINGNGKLDYNDPFISLGFDAFQLSTAVFTEDATGRRFLDFNGDGAYNVAQLTTAGEFLLKVDSATKDQYVDINGDSIRNPNEPQSGKTKSTLFIPQSAVDQNSSTINFNGNTYNVITINGTRFIDLDGNGQLTRDQKGRALEPFAVQSTTLSDADRNRLVLAIDSVDSTVFSSVATEVTKLRLNQTLSIAENQRVNSRVNELIRTGKIHVQLNDGDRLTLTELKAFVSANKAANATKADQVKSISSNLFTYSFKGNVNIGLKTQTSISGSKVLPSVKFDLDVNYPLFNIGNAKDSDATGLSVNFKNVGIDMGSFLGDYVEPILKTIDDVIKPIKPLIKALNADTKIFGKLGIANSFESDGKPGISLLEIAKKLSVGSPEQQAKIDKAIKFADTLTKLSAAIDKLSGALNDEKNLLSFGDFSLNDFRAASDDLANAASKSKNAPRLDNAPRTTVTLPNTSAASLSAQTQKSSAFKDKFNALKDLDGFEISLFNPSTVLSLITGEDNVDLIKYDMPDMDFSFMLQKSFPIWGPIAGKLEGGFNVKTDLSFGFDTHGIEEWAQTGYAADKSYLVFDGMYLDDWTPSGAEKDELSVQAYIAAGLGLDVGIASGFVKGGIEGIIGFDVVDTGERANASDGKVRGSDIIHALSTNPADLFNLHGTVNAFLGAEINVNLLFFSATVYEARLATIQLVKFQLDSSGLSGSSIAGKIQTGPLANATVWFDANNNFIRDDDEPFAITNYEGEYDLIIPDSVDMSVGSIRVQGGVDVTTGNQQTADVSIPVGSVGDGTALTALEDRLVTIPIDTTAIDINQDQLFDDSDREAYLTLLVSDPTNPTLDINRNGVIDATDLDAFDALLAIARNGGKLTTEESAARIKKAFGIDPSIALATFLHYDESIAGNPLAIPVMLGENSLNTFVEQAESFLAGLAHVGLSEHPYSDLFSEAIFDAIARQLLAGDLDLTDVDQVRAILTSAAHEADQLITNFNAHIDFDFMSSIINDVSQVLTASISLQHLVAEEATSPADAAKLITEAKVIENGKVVDDIYQVALGNRPSNELVDEDGHVDDAAIDAIKHVALPPVIKNVNDVFLFEDESATDILIKTASQMGGTAGLSVSVSSDNAALLPEGALVLTPTGSEGQYLLSITPKVGAYGSAWMTITVLDNNDGQVATERFQVTVAFRNHDPEAKPIHAVAVAGQAIEIDPLLVDGDIDGQALSVGLLTAPLGGEFAVIDHRRIRFTPDADFVGQDVVQYEVDDGNGGFAVGFITIDVIPAGVADVPRLEVIEGSDATNSGTIPAIPGLTPTLSASAGDVILSGDHTWLWYWHAGDGPVDSQTITITAHYDDGTTSAVSFDLVVKNADPTILSIVTSSPLVSPVMPFDVVTISGSFSDPSLSDSHQAVIDWGDGTTSAAVIDPTLRTFVGEHVYSEQGEFQVDVTLTDDDGGTTTASVVTKIGERPQLFIDGSAQALRFRDESFTLTTANVTPSTGNEFGFIFDWNDDGQFDQLVFGPDGTTVSHAFTQLGWNTFRVAVITKGGVFLDEQSISIDVIAIALITNEQTGLDDLVVSGTEGDDSYLFTQVDATTISLKTLKENGVEFNSSAEVYSGVTGGIQVYAGSGNDKIDATGLTTKNATLFGGDGNDSIFGGAQDDVIYADGAEGSSPDVIAGGSGNDTIVSDGAEGVGDQIAGDDGDDLILAGASNDTISGGAGNDVIIAGAGADLVNGDAGSDMIIAGKTRGIDLVSWQLVQAEWTSGRTLSTRVGHILGTDNTPRENGSVILNKNNTRLDDHSIDFVLGGTDEDWLIVDEAHDVTPDDDVLSDILTDLI